MNAFAESNRRQFLRSGAAMAGVALLMSRKSFAQSEETESLHIATNEYPWHTFAQRSRQNFRQPLEESIQQVKAAGLDGFEPLVDSLEYLNQLGPLLQKHQLKMNSLYVNSTLHDPAQIDKSMSDVVAIAKKAQELLQTKIVVTNPSPIQWGSGEDKTDAQLQRQAEALNKLGQQLKEAGMTLAYHNHDAELRQAAREFHHMLSGTDPQNVSFCLDAHWVYRGSGNSSVALFDIVNMYAERIVELHLRQSKNDIWTETFSQGDIDYARIHQILQEKNVSPHLVLEQAIEQKSPRKLNAQAAHQQGVAFARELFGA